MHAQSTNPNQPQRRSDGRAGPHAPLWNHHDATLLQICKPHLCSTETQLQAETTSGSAQNQRTFCR